MSQSWISVPKLYRLLQIGCFLGMSSFVVVYLGIALSRMFYPFDLEWMEGALVDHVARVLAGQPLYVAPDVSHTPFLYTPLYYYVSAVSATLFGLQPGSLRLVSFLASLGSLVLIYAFARRESGRVFCGWLALCFFAASFSLTGGWFDLARVDSLMLMFLLLSFFLVRFGREGRLWLLAGFVGSLAVMTKQSALVVLAPIACYTLIAGKSWRRILFVAGWLGPLLLAVIFFQWRSNGWFGYYTWLMPRGHAVAEGMWWRFWWTDLVKVVPVWIVLASTWLFVPKLRRSGTPIFFYVCSGAGVLASAYLSRLHSGGFVNVLMPLYAWLSLLAALGLEGFLGGWLENPENPLFIAGKAPLNRAQPQITWRKCGWLLGIYGQAFLLAYKPYLHVPNEADRQAGEAIVAELASTAGPVWVPYHGHLAQLAGKRSGAHLMAMSDVIRSRHKLAGVDLEAMVQEVFQAEAFELILLDYEWFPKSLGSYKKSKVKYQIKDSFYPVTGMRIRPERRYLRKKTRDQASENQVTEADQ